MLISMFVAAAVALQYSATSANALANAEKGQLQCYRPDIQKKTCQSIASYRRIAPGTYDNKALLPLGHGATLETHAPVVVRGNAVCGYVRSADVIAGEIKVGSAVLPADRAKPVLEHIAQALAPLANEEICTRYQPSAGELTAKVSVNGVYQPDKDETVKWIHPADGYTVTP